MIKLRNDENLFKVSDPVVTPQTTPTPKATSGTTLQSGVKATASTVPATPTATTQVYTPDYKALDSSFQDLVNSYESQKGDLKAQNATDRTSLANSFQQMLDSMNTTRKDNKTALQTSQGTISEDAYSKSRQIDAYMTSKGLGASGISELAGIQNRMATGEAVSKVANAYYKEQEALTKQEVNARQNYDTTLQTLNNSLQSAINKISTSIATDKMSFQQTVDNLKRQVVSDTNSALQAERAFAQAQEQLALSKYSAYKSGSSGSSNDSASMNVAVQTILENTTETPAMKIAGLMDLGYDRETATSMINRTPAPATSPQVTTVMPTIQKAVQNAQNTNTDDPSTGAGWLY